MQIGHEQFCPEAIETQGIMYHYVAGMGQQCYAQQESKSLFLLSVASEECGIVHTQHWGCSRVCLWLGMLHYTAAHCYGFQPPDSWGHIPVFRILAFDASELPPTPLN